MACASHHGANISDLDLVAHNIFKGWQLLLLHPVYAVHRARGNGILQATCNSPQSVPSISTYLLTPQHARPLPCSCQATLLILSSTTHRHTRCETGSTNGIYPGVQHLACEMDAYLNLVLVVHPLCIHTGPAMLGIYAKCARRTPNTHLTPYTGTLILQDTTCSVRPIV